MDQWTANSALSLSVLYEWCVSYTCETSTTLYYYSETCNFR